MPSPHGGVPPQHEPYPGPVPGVFPPGERVSGKDGNGVYRGAVFLPRASAARRWWARIIDGTFVVVLAAGVAAGAVLAAAKGVADDPVMAATAFSVYPALLLVFGALYGCMRSPGQALTGVVSLRCDSGKRVGFWRGMFRYLGVGFLPVTAVLALMSFLDLPVFFDESVRVYRR